MREKLAEVGSAYLTIRITPACAGKTELAHAKDLGAVGSPPRVREKPIERLRVYIWQGITPACAGKTDQLKECGILRGDHPRVCGKNQSKQVYLSSC